MIQRYRVIVTKNNVGFDRIGVRLELPPLVGFRHGSENSITIGVSEGSVNIPATGDLSSHEDIDRFKRALDLARALADGHIQIEGIVVEKK